MTLETYLGDIADYLEANGVTPVNISGNFEQFSNGIYLAPYGGMPVNFVVSDDANPFASDFQILISNTSNETALELAAKTIRLLRDVHNVNIGNTKFLLIQQKYGMFFLGKNNAEYYTYSLNFTILIA
jgi:Bacteriophage minor capsid protein